MSNNIALVDPIAGGLSGKIPLPTGTDKAYMFLNGEGEFVPVDGEDTRFNTDKCKSIVIFTGEVGDYLAGDGTFQPTSSIRLEGLGDVSLSENLSKGAILNYNGSSWTEINPGTDGYVLVSDSNNTDKLLWQTASKYVSVRSSMPSTSTSSLVGVYYNGNGNFELTKSGVNITSTGLLSAASISASTNIITNKFTSSAVKFSGLSTTGVLINDANGIITNKSYASGNKNSILMVNNAGTAVDWVSTSSLHDNRLILSGGNTITLKTGSTGDANKFLNEQGEYKAVTSETGVDKLRDLTDVTIDTTSIQKGALLYYNDTTNKKWGQLNPETDGYVLVSDSNNTNKITWQTASKYVSINSMASPSTMSIVGVLNTATSNYQLSKSGVTITSAGLLTATTVSATALSASNISSSTKIITSTLNVTNISASGTITSSRSYISSQYIYFPSISSTSTATGILLKQSDGKVVNKAYDSTNDKNKVLTVNDSGDGFEWVSTSSIHDSRITIDGGDTFTLKTGSTGHSSTKFLNEQGNYVTISNSGGGGGSGSFVDGRFDTDLMNFDNLPITFHQNSGSYRLTQAGTFVPNTNFYFITYKGVGPSTSEPTYKGSIHKYTYDTNSCAATTTNVSGNSLGITGGVLQHIPGTNSTYMFKINPGTKTCNSTTVTCSVYADVKLPTSANNGDIIKIIVLSTTYKSNNDNQLYTGGIRLFMSSNGSTLTTSNQLLYDTTFVTGYEHKLINGTDTPVTYYDYDTARRTGNTGVGKDLQYQTNELVFNYYNGKWYGVFIGFINKEVEDNDYN